MIVMLVAECNKNALKETRRIIDQFAPRRGRRTWLTAITENGLATLRKELKRTARRNTAVACHRIRGQKLTELLWIVGDRRRFDAQGNVPTNITYRDIIRAGDESDFHSAYSMSLLAAVAGLFHDFGKANQLFQQKLQNTRPSREPFRHEWVSLLLFTQWLSKAAKHSGANSKTDEYWLQQLAEITPDNIQELAQHPLDKPLHTEFSEYLLQNIRKNVKVSSKLPPIAAIVAWLIVSHHRLPTDQREENKASGLQQSGANSLKRINNQTLFIDTEWNSKPFPDVDLTDELKQQNCEFEHGLPFASRTWCAKARAIGKRCVKHLSNLQEYTHLSNPLVFHLSRLSLMMGDHYYSSLPPQANWQDDQYHAYANTFGFSQADQNSGKKGQLKQKLDEHNTGVAHYSYMIARHLPQLRDQLPCISNIAALKKRTRIPRFNWQNKAYEAALALRDSAQQHGFFGVNIASTGYGKTFANARIMEALNRPETGCRFTVLLGLRTLTLQTGDALQERLQLDDDDLAVLIGSAAVKQLHDYQKAEARKHSEQHLGQKQTSSFEWQSPEVLAEAAGSESTAAFAEHEYVKYEGEIRYQPLKQWLGNNAQLNKLVQAPVLVATIDRMIPASEGTRGGKQIAPMLRLLTSDLIIDEPDDFGLEDLPALCRLVYMAGLLGSRVLLSSATLPPSLVNALFSAYRTGRDSYDENHGRSAQGIYCGWFDEHKSHCQLHHSDNDFNDAHGTFSQYRVKQLSKQPAIHRGVIVPIHNDQQDNNYNASKCQAAQQMAHTLWQQIQQCQQQHYTQIPLQNQPKVTVPVSIGIVRMANIDPMIAVASRLMQQNAPDDSCWHFIIYHSRFPLIMRSAIEQQLDSLLKRDKKDLTYPLATHPLLQEKLATAPNKKHTIIVLASPVAEVGRDHDYDWAIIEPSSMRSIIQMAGRVQRHRQQQCETPNIYLLDKNLKALHNNQNISFNKPGFESDSNKLLDHALSACLPAQHIQTISAAARTVAPTTQPDLAEQTEAEQKPLDLITLEHLATEQTLQKAELWWKKSVASWYGELQRQQCFRDPQGQQDIDHFLWFDADDLERDYTIPLTFKRFSEDHSNFVTTHDIQQVEPFEVGNNIQLWQSHDYPQLIAAQAKHRNDQPEFTMQLLGTITVPDYSNQQSGQADVTWNYHPNLGVYKEWK